MATPRRGNAARPATKRNAPSAGAEGVSVGSGWTSGRLPAALRGEVEIVIAGLALAAGAFGADLYAVVIGMVVLSMVLAQPVMARLVLWAEPELRARRDTT